MAQSLKNIMGAGMGAESSKLIIGTIEDNIASTGTTQADAYQLTQDVNVVSVVIANSGVKLAPIPQPGDEVLIGNLGANTLSVYPGIGGSIQGGTINAPYLLAAGACAVFSARTGSANWVVLSGGGTAPVLAPTLGTLSFSATSFTVGALASGAINGATTLSTITASGLPTGLTINGAARTWGWDGTGTAGSSSFTLTEILAGAVGSPKPTTISYTISAASGSLTISTAPTLSGDAVVGQTIFATNGTYSATPDSYTPTWSVGGVVQSDQTGTTLLVLDEYAGLAIGYSEIAHKAAYTDSASNAATSTGAVANISLANAITAFTRTSTSGTVPMTWSVTFAANVYEGYYLRAQVFSDGTLSTQTQDITHRLTHADLQSGATIDLTSDGLTTIGATQYLQLGVFTTSPNSIPATFTYGTTISPTDAIVPMVWDASNKTTGATLSGGNLTVANTGSNAVARTTRAVSGAKYYAEFAVSSSGWTHIDLVDNTLSVATVQTEMVGQTDGADVHAAAFQCFDNFDVYTKFNNTSTHNSTLWLNNQPVDICWNDTMFWWRQNNGAWQPSGGDPSAGTGGINITSLATPRYIFGGPIAGGGVLTANFGTTPGGTAGFTRIIPTGAVAP